VSAVSTKEIGSEIEVTTSDGKKFVIAYNKTTRFLVQFRRSDDPKKWKTKSEWGEFSPAYNSYYCFDLQQYDQVLEKRILCTSNDNPILANEFSKNYVSKLHESTLNSITKKKRKATKKCQKRKKKTSKKKVQKKKTR
jgi:hypothetical protein